MAIDFAILFMWINGNKSLSPFFGQGLRCHRWWIYLTTGNCERVVYRLSDDRINTVQSKLGSVSALLSDSMKINVTLIAVVYFIGRLSHCVLKQGVSDCIHSLVFLLLLEGNDVIEQMFDVN